MWFLVTKLNNVSLWREEKNRRGGVEWRKRKSLLCLIPCGECFCSNKLLLPTNVRTEGQTKGGPGLCSSCSLCCWGPSSNSLRVHFICQTRLCGMGLSSASPLSSAHTSLFWTQKAPYCNSLAILFKLLPDTSWCGTEPAPDLKVTMVVPIFFSLILLKN